MPTVRECGSKDAQDPGPLKFMVYGDTGTGKTYSLLTLPAPMKPALILDIDGGSRQLHGVEGLGTIVTFDAESASGKPKLYDEVKKFLIAFHSKRAELPHPCEDYKTIVCDSFTVLVNGIQDRTLQWYMDKGKGGNAREDADMPPTQAEYGMIAHLGKKLVQSFVQLNRHLIVICHETGLVKDEVSGQSVAGPALQKSLATSLPRYFDEVLYSRVKGSKDNREYIWHTKGTGLYVARSREEMPSEIPQDYSQYFAK